ncbi:glycosyltransferase family 2 protein [Polynucleobacter sp. MWH-UH19D]|uniref:glycosyltransferase family 2 protein n=1 Tax=Polynucleobacter sp. MWH-UH19D TaxID=1855610 RepID=UPI00336503C9
MKNKDYHSHDFAPIVLFAYNRPEHLSKTLSALANNPEFSLSPLFIYCDGAKRSSDQVNVNKTRVIANQFPHPNKVVIESTLNLGLAASVIQGVTQITNKYGRIIVLEDDLIVDVYFLKFLNQALNQYENNSKVMQISAYMFPIPIFSQRATSLLLPNISSWGWATWRRAWKNFDPTSTGWELLLNNKAMRQEFDVGGSYAYSDMLFRQVLGEIDSWAIRWNWSVYLCSGLVLYPPVSLVKNIGFDGSGTHCAALDIDEVKFSSGIKDIKFPEDVRRSKEDLFHIEAALKKLSGPSYIRFLKSIANNFRRLRLRHNFL